ncbi:uncharacterized protein [Embiotoca jacksoni]|uniref:uncharacterized protein n=1 Tax=Embiotoca jacksoni TaxID=100190 RepID=UPI003704AD86
MKPLCIFLVLLCKIYQVQVIQTSSVIQDIGVKTAKVGENVTLHCVCRDDAVTFLSWYQQTLDGNPNLISTRMKESREANIYTTFKERFQVSALREKCINHLIITNLRLSDSATYYCGVLVFNNIEFGQGVFLQVETRLSNIRSTVHQPAMEPLRLGESVNLSCIVNAEACVGGQSLYWFRHGASQPAVVYPGEGRCTSLSSEKPHTAYCTLNLAIKSVSSSDAGTYYCALDSCGEIVFGDGTKVEIVAPPLLVSCLSVALAVSITVLLVLAFIMYKVQKKLCSVCKGTVSHVACPAASDAVSQEADSLHYAALSLKRNSEQHHQEDNMENVCVYSRVRSRHE